VIAVFTKYDQFRRNVKMKLEDQGRDPAPFDADVERIFNKYYLANLRGSPPFVRLESEDFVNPLTFFTLIAFLQECICLTNAVPTLLKRLPRRSLEASFYSCC
jgi:hypothetical protein